MWIQFNSLDDEIGFPIYFACFTGIDWANLSTSNSSRPEKRKYQFHHLKKILSVEDMIPLNLASFLDHEY